jgi:hypothetical protein
MDLAHPFLDTKTLRCDITKGRRQAWRVGDATPLFLCPVANVALMAPFSLQFTHGPPPFNPLYVFTPFFFIFISRHNIHGPECMSYYSPLPQLSSHLGTRSDLNGATTASTKTFLTALVLNGAIATGEIVAFTLVRRYFRLIYEPRSLSVFEA